MRWTTALAVVVVGAMWAWGWCQTSQAELRDDDPAAASQPAEGFSTGPTPEWAKAPLAEAKAGAAKTQPERLVWRGPASNMTEKEFRLRELMEKVVPEIRFREIKFENALSFFRDLQRVSINPNWAAMEAIGVTKTTEVTLQLRDVTFETALRELLSKVAGKEGVLDYMVREGVIKISTVEDLSSLKYVLVFDVRWFCKQVTPEELFARRPIAGIGPDRAVKPARLPTRQEQAKSFVDLLRTSVLPDTWEPTGDAQICLVDGFMPVRQTANGHREVAKLLGQLREYSRMQVTAEVRALAVDRDTLARAIVAWLPATAPPDFSDAIIGAAEDKQIDALLKAVWPDMPKDADGVRITLFNGQDAMVGIEPPARGAVLPRAAVVKLWSTWQRSVWVKGKPPHYEQRPPEPPPALVKDAVTLKLSLTVTGDRKHLVASFSPVPQPAKPKPADAKATRAAAPDAPIRLGVGEIQGDREMVLVRDLGTLLLALPMPDEAGRVMLVMVRPQILMDEGIEP